MANTFTRTLTVNKDQKHKKDVHLLDGDAVVYGITHEGKGKVSEILKFEAGGAEALLAEVEWVGDRKDRVRFPGGQWQSVTEAWEHYDVTKDREPFLTSFTGADGRKYIWHLLGSMKVLSVGDKSGPVIAKHSEQETTGSVELTSAASSAGEMLFVTFLVAEGSRARGRFNWIRPMNVPGVPTMSL